MCGYTLQGFTSPEKRCYVCVLLCVSVKSPTYSVALCPLSTSECDPTLQAAPPGQCWEGQASTNTAEGEDGKVGPSVSGACDVEERKKRSH